MNVGDKVIVDGKETEITATAFDDVGTKVYMVKGSMKDYYEEELVQVEEDIFIIKSFLEDKEMLLKHPCWISEKTVQAIENLEEQNKEQEKIIELMAFELATKDENYLYRSIDDIIECFKKKAKVSE